MNSNDYTRKDFIKHLTAMTLASFGLTNPLFAQSKKILNSNQHDYTILKKNDVILFQGDSITDYGRDRKIMQPNIARALGPGYTLIAASELLYNLPERDLVFYNRGVSGNVVPQLLKRWERDTLALKPDILSILIGVNDYWHILTNGYKGTLSSYENEYHQLLLRTQKALPNVKLLIGEPYALKGGRAITSKWDLQTFQKYREAARRIAADFGAAFIPYQSIYEAAMKKAPVDYWSIDGVHPSVAGCQLMAHAWVNTIRIMHT